MDSMMAVEIKQTLERQFEVFLTPQDIRSMTFAKLQEIGASDDKEKKNDSNEPKSVNDLSDVGLKYLIRAVGDEKSAYYPVVRIPSLYEDGSTVEEPLTNHCTIFVIPGLEGIASMMEPLSKNLNMQVLCLQYDISGVASTIEEMAINHYQLIEQRLPADQEYFILGYSFGGLIALEVVKLLEKNNRKGKLWLIDSAPQFLRVTTELSVSGENPLDDEIQIQLLKRFFDLVWPQNKDKLLMEFGNINSWDERLNYFVEKVPDDVNYSKSYQKQLFNSAYIKLKAIINYDETPTVILKTPTLLIRPTEQVLPITEDYGLSKYFESSVMVHFVEGNHYTILENKKIGELIGQSIAAN
ncbi:Thioesterase,Alpha/Beta hydrolase fold [Cinara cedri]|uniref:oleoyl-[acyl-carrier-protein] hydrolase n=1 Tax=Cinara cedri TaxID=506608 RepID=A0A5E4MJZ0_9HEMI|nr:Thioesterase,Alpha/Beta hydrolase fold [Cinara cedri]